ncbi:HmuY family protein [Zhouia sp. PK063]|uniref:HmuY family protein n=1 Tax=Zhouia sp. PK063 TaxID=3373602 RepID=UPI0037A6FB02
MRKLILLQALCIISLLVSCSSDDDGGTTTIPAVESAVIDVNSGGPNEPNQVYIDLSTSETTTVRRDAWELGFYTGTENRVYLNSSILATAAELPEFTDLDNVNSETVFNEALAFKSLNLQTYQTVAVKVQNVTQLLEGLPLGYSMYGDLDEDISFTDGKSGALNETAIAAISTTASANHVYVVSLGSAIPAEAPEAGSIATTGDHRGFYKIRIYMDGSDYVLQYAPLDATTYSEATIHKDSNYNLITFSLAEGKQVSTAPAKLNWDINYTSVFSYYGNLGIIAGLTYSDYALTNTLSGVKIYTVYTSTTDDEGNTVATDEPTYTEFTAANIVASEFTGDDRTVIGSDWRSTSTGAKSDRYYIIKDTEGNYYKLQFTAALSESGERGYPQFKYELL